MDEPTNESPRDLQDTLDMVREGLTAQASLEILNPLFDEVHKELDDLNYRAYLQGNVSSEFSSLFSCMKAAIETLRSKLESKVSVGEGLLPHAMRSVAEHAGPGAPGEPDV